MKKRHLEIALSKAEDIEEPRAIWEQYRTPPEMVADILWMALGNDDLIDKRIIELGCGGAPFALGSLMMGASKVVGIDIDDRAVDLAYSNLEMYKDEGILMESVEALFKVGDISSNDLEMEMADTVFMNPPFGSQNKHADRPFIDEACNYGRSIYSIHNGGTEKFLIKHYTSRNFKIFDIQRTAMSIPYRFHFHTKERSSIEVLIVHAVRN